MNKGRIFVQRLESEVAPYKQIQGIGGKYGASKAVWLWDRKVGLSGSFMKSTQVPIILHRKIKWDDSNDPSVTKISSVF